MTRYGQPDLRHRHIECVLIFNVLEQYVSSSAVMTQREERFFWPFCAIAQAATTLLDVLPP